LRILCRLTSGNRQLACACRTAGRWRGGSEVEFKRGGGPVGATAGETVPGLTFILSACKCPALDTAMSVTTDAVQLLGGYGYVKRDAKITQIYEGTNQIQRMVMVRSC
jgi:alkylation response protein AidB-like acyl-CoA dehydrogenase